MILIFLAYFTLVVLQCRADLPEGSNSNLGEAVQFLREFDREGSGMCFRLNSARWQYSTNTTEANRRRKLEQEALHAKFERLSWKRATTFAWRRLPDPVARRQLMMLVLDGRSSLPDDKFSELQQVVAEMKDIFSRAEICPFSTRTGLYCNLRIDSDIINAMAQSRDYEEQLYLWQAWHEAVGPPLKSKYERYIQLVNEAALRNGFHDAGEQMRASYEDSNFEEHVSQVWASLAPLYRKLHAYVRHRLVQHYGRHRIRPDGPLPAHVMGNMWAQNWKNLASLVLPFPRKIPIDVTSEMLRQGYTPSRMFQVAEEFFTSMGLRALPPEFWQYSMLEKPLDREVICSASAWDFCNQRDYRIKQCTSITMEDLLALHHEMAHIQYYLQYADQPFLFRGGANPAFHEALGDAMALFAGNPRHLHKIGLLNNASDDHESNINFLMSVALEKVAYLPFAYVVDKWRWQLFAGQWNVDEMNSHWWELRLRHQGVIPPIPRTEQDFDPGAKYHIAADMPYIRYFVSLVLQFQLYESLCQSTGHYGPLHKCDIYRSSAAGRLLEEMLSLGSSRPWPDVIRIMTRGRTDKLDPRPLLEYFKPLEDWLIMENKDERVVGWSATEQETDIFEKAPVLRNVTWKDNCSFQLWPGMEQFKIFHIMGYNNTSVLNASENETSLSLSGVVMLTVENTTIFTNMNTIFLLPSLRSLKIIFCDLPNIKYDDEHITEGESQISVLHIFYSNVSDIPIKLFSKLLYATNINLTGNSLTKCPNYAFNGLSQVLELTLSYNLISDIESHCLSNMESLEVLDLSFNNLSMLGENIFQGLHNLVYLVLSNNKFSSVGNNALFPLTNLGVLVLSNNQLIEEPRINSDFMYTVNLSHNYLSSVTHITETTTEIVDLDLSFNNIRNLNINNVENLNLSYNSLQELPYTLASALDDMKIVDLGANILFCCHENITMLRNYTTKIRNLGVANFAECEVNGARIVLDGNVTYDSVCGEIQDIINHANIWTITVILSMLVVAFMVFIHYYRAELAYIGHLFKMRKIGLRNDDDRYNMCTYDAFVCYSGKDFEFVSTQLLANLEGGPEGYRFCVHDRDFTLGVAIDTNVRISLQKSRKVIFLLSEDFVTSKWCQLELEMANHKMFEEDRNYIILVNLERLDREKLPLHLRYLMDTRTYLEWPEDTENEKHVERCWQRLRFALGDSIGKKTGKPYKEGTVLDV